MPSSDKSESNVSTFSLYIVVISRVVYSGIASLLITYILGTVVFKWNLPTIPIELIDISWFVLYIMVVAIVIGLGFWIWVALSWSTAYLICPSVRTEFKKKKNENDSK